MNLIPQMKMLHLHKIIITPMQYALQFNCYATGLNIKPKKNLKKGQIIEKKKMEVETDVNKIINYCCGSNFYKEGEDVKLKPDSEYPDWLWTLHTGPPIPLEQLDPNTKQYWRRMRQLGLIRNNRLAKYKKF